MSWIAPLLEGPWVLWDVIMPAHEVVYLKGIFEASPGVGSVFAQPRPRHRRRTDGGRVTVAAPVGMETEAARILCDVQREIGDSMTVVCVSGAQCSRLTASIRDLSTTVA
jgi:hypothetical protein